jgi:hypothetical protein
VSIYENFVDCLFSSCFSVAILLKKYPTQRKSKTMAASDASVDKIALSIETLSLVESKKVPHPDDNIILIAEASGDARDTTQPSMFVVTRREASISQVIRDMMGNDPHQVQFRLQGVKSDELAAIVEYMRHHNGQDAAPVPEPLTSTEMKDVCADAWDAAFIDKYGCAKNRSEKQSNAVFYRICLASNRLQMNVLRQLCMAKMASLIKGKPIDQVVSIFEGECDS